MIHKLTDVLDLQDDNSSGVGWGAQSRTAGTYNGVGVDLTLYEGGIGWFISADTFGSSATLDAHLEDSADNSSFAALSTPITITQMLAAGNAVIQTVVRNPRRYLRVVVVIGTAAVVFSATFVGQKKTL